MIAKVRDRGQGECSKEQVLLAVRKCRGLAYLVADHLGVDPSTVSRYRDAWPEVEEAFQVARGRVLDKTEDNLFKAAERGEAWAMSFVLKTVGKDRGYSERKEVAHSGEVQLKVSGAVEVDVSTLSQDIAVALLDQLKATQKPSLASQVRDGALLECKPVPETIEGVIVPPGASQSPSCVSPPPEQEGIVVKMRKRKPISP